MRRLQQLEVENAKLKRIVADLTLDREMLQEGRPPKALRPARKRKLVDESRGVWGVSIRRACRVFLVDTSTCHYRYRSRRAGQAGLEHRIRELSETRVRYGYRRVHVMLRREGWMINQKRTRPIWRELGLQLRNKTPERRVKAKLREDRSIALAVNGTWAMDFIHDQLATARKLRVLTVVDTLSPVFDARFGYSGEDVVASLDRVRTEAGFPQTIRVDRGSAFISRDPDLLACLHGVTLDFSRPGQADRQRPHRSVQRSLPERVPEHPLIPDPCRCPEKLEAWRRYYNEGQTPRRDRVQTPDRLMNPDSATGQPSG